MEKLPRNVLKKILSYVHSEDLVVLKDVSKYFNDIIDQEIGITLYVGAGNPVYWLDGPKWQPVSSICEQGVSKCYFSEIETPLPSSGFKYPKLVREISFDGFIERTNFNKILSQVSSTLTRLTLHTSTLCFLKSIHLKFWHLPALHELQIYCYGCHSAMSWSYIDDCIVDNFGIILENNHFPKLKSLRLSTLFIYKRELEMTKAIITFLLKHSMTMRRLRMEFRYEGVTNDDIIHNPCIENSLKVALRLKRIKLNYFKIHFWFNGSPKLHTIWHELLSHQNTLNTLVHVTGKGWTPFPTAVIQKNHATLTRVTIRMNLANDFFDCRIFQDCQNLKRLCLMNKDQRRSTTKSKIWSPNKTKKLDRRWENAPILTNPYLLPKLIDTLFISWIKINRDEFHHLYCHHLTQLKELSLTFVGGEGIFGVHKNTLASFLQDRRLKRFTVLHGFNSSCTSLSDEEKKDPYQVLVAALLKNKCLYLDVIRKKDGSYDLIR